MVQLNERERVKLLMMVRYDDRRRSYRQAQDIPRSRTDIPIYRIPPCSEI